jgi:hypothetical protein
MGHHAASLHSLPAGYVAKYDARSTFVCIYNVDLSVVEVGTRKLQGCCIGQRRGLRSFSKKSCAYTQRSCMGHTMLMAAS